MMLRRFFSSCSEALVADRRCFAAISFRPFLLQAPPSSNRSIPSVETPNSQCIVPPSAYAAAELVKTRSRAWSPLQPCTVHHALFSTASPTFEVKRRPVNSRKGQIVTLTSNAIKRLHEICNTPGKIVKLLFVVKGCNGYSYEMELVDISSLDAMDEIVRDQAGAPVLAIENKAAFHLLGCHIDYQVSQLEEGFVFDNPNVTSKCGCGQSFQF
ncbi:HesB-like domain containing protein, putative [Babesia bigemina]|uniref:HesB-like domain containing protein, putative n=1 Tax=Babesia bigemina TaxID=5866 RepID=A0A061DDZ5_BABBI|nr:HesB-like domain containing protein, putative [Babesia bigemina]CDR96720.1 HesB-like domain containing protein, putative [Babesia bigemina]|eukprot:XP_012768906.1 HesB-like domain containing protein, putative [Babesia bigemina]